MVRYFCVHTLYYALCIHDHFLVASRLLKEKMSPKRSRRSFLGSFSEQLMLWPPIHTTGVWIRGVRVFTLDPTFPSFFFIQVRMDAARTRGTREEWKARASFYLVISPSPSEVNRSRSSWSGSKRSVDLSSFVCISRTFATFPQSKRFDLGRIVGGKSTGFHPLREIPSARGRRISRKDEARRDGNGS